WRSRPTLPRPCVSWRAMKPPTSPGRHWWSTAAGRRRAWAAHPRGCGRAAAMQAEAEPGGVPGQGDGLLSEPMVVPAEWLDLYGHMNAARYFQVFIDTGYALLGRLGLGDAYTRSQRRGIFLADARIH